MCQSVTLAAVLLHNFINTALRRAESFDDGTEAAELAQYMSEPLATMGHGTDDDVKTQLDNMVDLASSRGIDFDPDAMAALFPFTGRGRMLAIGYFGYQYAKNDHFDGAAVKKRLRLALYHQADKRACRPNKM